MHIKSSLFLAVILDCKFGFMTDRQYGWVFTIGGTDVIFHVIGSQQILGTHLFG